MNKAIAMGMLFLSLVWFELASAQGQNEEVFNAIVIDKQRNETLVSDIGREAFLPQGKLSKNLPGKRGESDISIPLRIIKKIDFILNKESGWNTVEILFIDGDKTKILIWDPTVFKGKCKYGNYEIRVSNIASIEFLTDGNFRRCPLCNRMYYDLELRYKDQT